VTPDPRTLDHVAIVVADLDATIDLYVNTLGFRVVYRETVADQGIEAVGLDAGDSVIELLRPLDAASAIARFLGDAGLVEKPAVRETPVKSRPKARAQERLKAAEEAAGAAASRS